MERSQIERDLTNAAMTNEPERIKKLIHIFDDPYEAVKDAHAIVVLTEWDEFKVSCDHSVMNLRFVVILEYVLL